jgi:hypothetical protein
MALHVRRAVSGGLDRALTRNGALLAAAFFVASVLQGAFVWALATTYVPLGMAGAAAPAGAPAPGTSPPELVSVAAALLGGLTGGVLTVPIHVVAVRALVDDGRDRIPDQLVFRSIGPTTLRFLAASVLRALAVFVLAFVGTFVVILGAVAVFVALPESLGTTLVGSWYGPALFVLGVLVALLPAAFVLLTFAFVGQEVAVRETTVLQAFVRSWRVVAGNRLRLGAAVVVPYGVNLAFGLLVGRFVPETTFRSPAFLLRQAVLSLESSVVLLLVVAITSQAWVQLTGVDGPLDEYWTDEEPDPEPRGEGSATGE